MSKKIRSIFFVLFRSKNEWCFFPFPTLEVSRIPEYKLLMVDVIWLFFKLRLSVHNKVKKYEQD